MIKKITPEVSIAILLVYAHVLYAFLQSSEDGWKIQSMFFVNPITVRTD